MTWGESAELIGLKTRDMSMKTTRRIYAAVWTLHVAADRVAAGQPQLHPLSVGGLEREAEDDIGWQPKYDTLETFKITMRAKGLLPEAPAPSRRRRHLSPRGTRGATFLIPGA